MYLHTNVLGRYCSQKLLRLLKKSAEMFCINKLRNQKIKGVKEN